MAESINALRLNARVKEVGHPLLQYRRLADPPAPGDRVDPGPVHRQMLEQGVAVGEGQAPQLPELGVHRAEYL